MSKQRITAGQLCAAMGGSLVRGTADCRLGGIMTRCTQVVPGLVYFDVKGGPGGNQNILEAIKNGAVGVVVSKYKKVLPFEDEKVFVIAVPKVWPAFWQAVKFYRDMYDIPVAGVTGTSGKTTTKEMLAAIFRLRWKTLKTTGNLNLPHFVPPHVMRLKWGYQAAVFEIGMNRPGHVSTQAKIIQPSVGVITHIGTGHVEHLGSYENVIKEKAGIIDGIPDNGYLVLNADDTATGKIDLTGFRGKVLYYGLENQADYKAYDIEYRPRGISFKIKLKGLEHRFSVPTFGRHNVYNALAAVAAADVFGFDAATIQKGLATYRRPPMRLQLVKGLKNSTIINDTYNANPDSVMAGLEVLSSLAQGKTSVAVLGNMLEQGALAVESHRKVGQKAAELNIDWLVTVGQLAREIAQGAASNTQKMKIWSYRLKKQAAQFLQANLPEGAVVLVKGSRGAYMENMVRALKKPEPQPVADDK